MSDLRCLVNQRLLQDVRLKALSLVFIIIDRFGLKIKVNNVCYIRALESKKAINLRSL